MKLLCISNGHGEDAIAAHILTPLRQSHPDISLSALPITGSGSPYQSINIPIIGRTQVLPSGGFLNRDARQLARDMNQGLIALTRSQLSALKTWSKTGSRQTDKFILAVGDIVPLIFAYRSGLPYAFVGTAKSEYWHRDERGKLPATTLAENLAGWSGSVYLPWERWLMSRPNCKAAFVRDGLTAQQLNRLGIRAQYSGNPMMDGLAPTGKLTALLSELVKSSLQPPAVDSQTQAANGSIGLSPGVDRAKATARYVTQKQQPTTPLTIVLLPGSRPMEAYENWANIIAAVPSLTQALPRRPLILLAAIASSLSLKKLQAPLSSWQLQPGSYPIFTQQSVTLLLVNDAYSDCLHQAEIAIATAGTATEQFVGLGKPAITLPGNGPQFTPAFATVQAKMLGPSIQMVNKPEDVGPAIAQIISDPDRLHLIYENGKQRMGEPGAGGAIAQQLDKLIKRSSSPSP
ncbi:MAG: lipid-A-disaccharide synthase-related protein [Phormidesmis sp.]